MNFSLILISYVFSFSYFIMFSLMVCFFPHAEIDGLTTTVNRRYHEKDNKNGDQPIDHFLIILDGRSVGIGRKFDFAVI